MNSCYFCKKKFPDRITTIDSKYAFSEWRSEFDNHDCLFFSKINVSTCIPCGKKYYKWSNLNTSKKIKQLTNRSIIGKFKKIKLKSYDIKTALDNCVICNVETSYKMTDPIGKRQNYIECFGQLCINCSI